MSNREKQHGNSSTGSSNTDVEPTQIESGIREEDYGWNRGLSPRAVIMLALGGGVGIGLWIGTGTALAAAGPAGCALAYGLVAMAIYTEFQSIGEMTCYKPIHGGYIRQTMEYLDQAAAFACGMNAWFSWVITIPAQVVACISVLQYWEAPRNFPMAAYITIFLVLSALPNLLGVRIYGYVQTYMSIIKIVAITGCMCFMFLMASGAFPKTGGALEFRYWKNPGAFHNGFKGLSKALIQAVFSCTSAGWIALTAGEMKDPRRTVKKSIDPLFWRMFIFFLVNVWLVGMCLPYNDKDLNNATGTLASPFILAVRNGGSPNFAHLLNALVFVTVFSCGITSFYVASRTMTQMSDLGIIHPIFGKKDEAGRPWVALLASGILGGGLAYLNLNNTAKEVYAWFSSLFGAAELLNWLLIFFAHLRFRQGLKAQGIDCRKLPFYSRAAPYAQYFGILLTTFFLAVQLYFAIFPYTGKPSASNFFSTFVIVPLFIVDYLAYKWFFKTKIVAPMDMDFTPAEYFNKVDRDEEEEERLNPTPKPTIMKRFWNLRTGLIA